MTNSFLVLTSIYKNRIRVSANAIASYTKSAGYSTTVALLEGSSIEVLESPEDIDSMLSEVYFTIKSRRPTENPDNYEMIPYKNPEIDYEAICESAEFSVSREEKES